MIAYLISLSAEDHYSQAAKIKLTLGLVRSNKVVYFHAVTLFSLVSSWACWQSTESRKRLMSKVTKFVDQVCTILSFSYLRNLFHFFHHIIKVAMY